MRKEVGEGDGKEEKGWDERRKGRDKARIGRKAWEQREGKETAKERERR